MALTPTIQTSQFGVTTVFEAGGDVQTSQFDITAIYNYPSERVDISQLDVVTVGLVQSNLQVSQLDIIAIVRGNIFNPRLRAWWFELDDHEIWVLNLGGRKTLIYDLSTEKWAWWSNPEADHWRANIGTNWTASGAIAHDYGSDVIVGDDSTGILWVLDPKQGYDDSVRPEERELGVQFPFPRVATGQVLARGREFISCYEVYLVCDPGDPSLTGASVELLFSDDGGRSYVSAGTIAAQPGNFQQEFAWRSLGIIGAPGRMFRLEDSGALRQIDEMSIANG